MTILADTSYRLLIADDDAGVRAALCAIFEPYFDLIEAGSGDEAIALIGEVRIDIALLDMHMPPTSGLDTLRVLKRVYVDAPGIIVTADATDDLRRDAAEACAFRVLDKPIAKAELVATVDMALRAAYRDYAGLA